LKVRSEYWIEDFPGESKTVITLEWDNFVFVLYPIIRVNAERIDSDIIPFLRDRESKPPIPPQSVDTGATLHHGCRDWVVAKVLPRLRVQIPVDRDTLQWVAIGVESLYPLV
jgi:hypothetical protein